MSQRPTPDWSLEEELWRAGAKLVAGVDEAGRGALCGPVVAAAVILQTEREHPYRDSKTLDAARRAALADQVRVEAVAYAVGFASAAEVDALNVLAATKLAARRALAALVPQADGLVTGYLRAAGVGWRDVRPLQRATRAVTRSPPPAS
ncbi:MAG TPA: hypothetical protein PLT07_12675 [Trueperaceae bacterium]|nr:hypothetical protein [Trueperaceae bacterium]